MDHTRVWKSEASDKKWYFLVNDFKFPINVGDLTAEEKQLLQTYDITHPSIGSFIKKVRKELADDPANNVEVFDLRNTNP